MEHNGTEKTNFDFDRNSHYFIRDVVGGAFSDSLYQNKMKEDFHITF